MASPPLVLDGRSLTPEAVVEVARRRRQVAFSADALARVAKGRAVVMAHLAQCKAVYGLTTGLGSRSGHRLEDYALADFSRLTVLGRANAVGPALPRDAVRATLLCRLNGLLLGGAGVQVSVAECFAAVLNAGVHPVIPAIGSIGAGDLCSLAGVARALIGEGEAEWQGETLPAGEALRKAGIAPLQLGPKDGLAIANASSFTLGLAALVAADAKKLLHQAQAAAALTFEGFRGNLSPLDPRVTAARPAPGQQQAATEILDLLEGSDLLEPGAARRVQDPISLRCVAQIHGAAIAALDFLAPALDADLNGAGDNPLVLIEQDDILSTGNFHTTALALALETLAQAFAHLAATSASRAARLLSGRFTGLAENLTTFGSGRSGFAPLSKILEALVQEIRHLALPAPQEQRFGADGQEDDVNATAFSAKKAGDLLTRLRYVLAIEMILAAQAVELRETLRLGKGTAALYRAIRDAVAALEDDRAHGPDVERLAEFLKDSEDAWIPAR